METPNGCHHVLYVKKMAIAKTKSNLSRKTEIKDTSMNCLLQLNCPKIWKTKTRITGLLLTIHLLTQHALEVPLKANGYSAQAPLRQKLKRCFAQHGTPKKGKQFTVSLAQKVAQLYRIHEMFFTAKLAYRRYFIQRSTRAGKIVKIFSHFGVEKSIDGTRISTYFLEYKRTPHITRLDFQRIN